MTLQDFIDSASSEAVKNGFLNVKNNHLVNHEFLPDGNPLKSATYDTVKNHFNGISTFSPEEVKAYLASSSILHCFDGWSYLSASIHSFLNCDIPMSIHLAYYAELRASSSFLSTEGIGIFNSHHFSIDNNDQIQGNPNLADKNTTHKFIWEALNCWINSTNQSDVLGCFFYYGRSFNEWLQYIPNSNSIENSAMFLKNWLKEWSIDIDKFQKDRDARNHFSYRPSLNRGFNFSNLSIKIEKINSFWKILEPNSPNRFLLLDKYLFKLLLDKIHFIINQSGISLSKEDMINKTFENAGMPIDAALKRIFTNDTNHIIFEKSNDLATDANGLPDALAIIARSILMLRLASGATSNLIKTSDVSRQELDFFFNTIGIDGGFWSPGEAPIDFCDLWADINDLLIEFEDLATEPIVTLNKINNLNISTYSQFTRAAVWGTGL